MIGARRLALDGLPASQAREVLTRRLGRRRVDEEPAAVAEVVERCGGLPLALGIVAARAFNRPLATVVDELREASLDAFDAGELTANLRAALACSYEALSPGAARLFGLLGYAPGHDIGTAAVRSLAAAPPSRWRTAARGSRPSSRRSAPCRGAAASGSPGPR